MNNTKDEDDDLNLKIGLDSKKFRKNDGEGSVTQVNLQDLPDNPRNVVPSGLGQNVVGFKRDGSKQIKFSRGDKEFIADVIKYRPNHKQPSATGQDTHISVEHLNDGLTGLNLGQSPDQGSTGLEDEYKGLYVTPAYTLKTPFPHGSFLPLAELIARLKPGNDTYLKQDLTKLKNKEAPFPVYNDKGIEDPHSYDFFKAYCPPPEKLSREAKALLDSKGIKFKLTPAQTEAQEMAKLGTFYAGMLEMSQKVTGLRYDVISRFFNEAITEDLSFIIVVPPVYTDAIRINLGISVNTTDAIKKELEDRINRVRDKLKFKPSCTVQIPASGVQNFPDLSLLSCHPCGLFYVYLDAVSYSRWKQGLENDLQGSWPVRPSRPMPDEQQAKDANVALGCVEREIPGKPTESRVDQGSLEAGGATKRKPIQKVVMNNTSPNDLVKPWWNQKEKLVAEWLHRCAFSFGGLWLDDAPAAPNSAQRQSNLIIGTCESNTNMIRAEAFIKRAVQNNPGAKAHVKTSIEYDPNWSLPYMAVEKYIWLAPTLLYEFIITLKNHQQMAGSTSFYPFSRVLCSRLELEIDFIMEEAVWAWPSVSTFTQKPDDKVGINGTGKDEESDEHDGVIVT